MSDLKRTIFTARGKLSFTDWRPVKASHLLLVSSYVQHWSVGFLYINDQTGLELRLLLKILAWTFT